MGGYMGNWSMGNNDNTNLHHILATKKRVLLGK